MKQKRYLLISLLIFCLFVTLQWGYANTTILSNYRYGLTFKAHTVNQDQRTSLDLTPDYFRWLYTAFTRATKTLYLVNYPKEQVE